MLISISRLDLSLFSAGKKLQKSHFCYKYIHESDEYKKWSTVKRLFDRNPNSNSFERTHSSYPLKFMFYNLSNVSSHVEIK